MVEVSSIRVKDGRWDNYMAYLAGPYKTLLDAQINAGIIVEWDAYSVQPRTPQERNLILTVTYANMAALDGLEDKTEPLTRTTLGQDRAQGERNYADRATMREVLGSQLIRELKLR